MTERYVAFTKLLKVKRFPIKVLPRSAFRLILQWM